MKPTTSSRIAVRSTTHLQQRILLLRKTLTFTKSVSTHPTVKESQLRKLATQNANENAKLHTKPTKLNLMSSERAWNWIQILLAWANRKRSLGMESTTVIYLRWRKAMSHTLTACRRKNNRTGRSWQRGEVLIQSCGETTVKVSQTQSLLRTVMPNINGSVIASNRTNII